MLVDVKFVFKKESFKTLEVVKTIHDQGIFQAYFVPSRLVYNTPFEILLQDGDGVPVEGVEVFINDVTQGDTDINGKISITIPKE